MALGCLARDFLPSSLSFSWSYQNSRGVSGRSVQSFPAVLREGKYAASSQVLLPPSSIPQGSEEHLLCRVQHPNGDRSVKVPLPGEPGSSRGRGRGSGQACPRYITLRAPRPRPSPSPCSPSPPVHSIF